MGGGDRETPRSAARDEVRSGITIGSLKHRLCVNFAPEKVRPAVLHLLWKSAVRCDLSRPLSHHRLEVAE